MTRLNLVTLSLLGAGVLLGGCAKRECTDEERERAGADENDDCEVIEPLKEFEAEDSETRSIEWSSGLDLRIRGQIRDVDMVRGSADEIRVVYTAEVDLAQGRERDVVERTLAHLTTSLEQDGSAIVISADRGESDAALGARIRVELPSNFDADISIAKPSGMPGDVELEYLGDTRALDIDMNSTGADLEISDAGNLELVEINTHGDITVADPFSNLQQGVLHSTIGDIEALFDAVPESHVRIVADFGDVVVEVPADGDFNLSGVAERGVALGSLPADCVASAKPSPKKMRCNAGDPDGLTFDLEAWAEITVGYR